ncbi:hypothetical protein FACS189493_0300 [Spirochaetia bacterium]|nr:hypothetical protein FACS189493_0300 [Spirochaetia bacterium]
MEHIDSAIIQFVVENLKRVPYYLNENVQKVIANAVKLAKPDLRITKNRDVPCMDALEKLI